MSHNFSVLRANLFKQQPLNAQVEVLHYVPDHNAYLGVAVSKRQTKTLQRPIDFAIYQVGEWRARLLNDAAPELGLVLSDAEKLVILNGGLPDRLVAVAEGKATARGWVTKRLAAVHAMYELLGAQKRGDYDAISHWANQLESALKVIDAGLSDIRKGYKRRIPNLGNDLRALKLFSRFAFKQIRDEPIGLTSMESPKWEDARQEVRESRNLARGLREPSLKQPLVSSGEVFWVVAWLYPFIPKVRFPDAAVHSIKVGVATKNGAVADAD